MSQQKIYFPNLNGLRFIAAFMVIIHHLEQLLSILGYDNYWSNSIIGSIGGLGVQLFFVLSGFLITYLLLAEEQKTKTISIKDFYIRRILRIWPLYYFVVMLAYFILPHFDLFYIQGLDKGYTVFYFLLFILFLPNVVLNCFGVVVPYVSQSWSVGVEEQFYLIWPLLMKFFKKKIVVLLSIIVIYLGMRYVGFGFIKYLGGDGESLTLIRNFWKGFTISSMAIGGVFAYLLYSRHALLKYVLTKTNFYISLSVVLSFILFSVRIPSFLYVVLFGIIIVNLAANENIKNVLENRILNYLGKISYGLYMYHVIAIVLCIKVFVALGILKYHLILLLVTTLVTILIAGFSYYIMESKFIKMKARFSKIISGDNAK